MPEKHLIEFPDSGFEPIWIDEGIELSAVLTVLNSPILFGCRSGICGTCLAEVEADPDRLTEPGEDEAEALAIFAPGNPRARLACQLRLTTSLRLLKIEAC